MGQCCKKISGNTAQESDSGKEMALITKKNLKSFETTNNDSQFTYFLGVFDLLSLG